MYLEPISLNKNVRPVVTFGPISSRGYLQVRFRPSPAVGRDSVVVAQTFVWTCLCRRFVDKTQISDRSRNTWPSGRVVDFPYL